MDSYYVISPSGYACLILMAHAFRGYPSGSPKSRARVTTLAQIMHLCYHPGFPEAYAYTVKFGPRQSF